MPERRLPAALFGLVALRAAGDVLRLLTDPERYRNFEEAYNATVGWFVAHAGLWDAVPDLQYKSFCGGCTVVSVLAAPVLGVAGDSFLAWKAIAVLWSAATLVTGFLAVDRRFGRTSAWAMAALLAVPPDGLAGLSLMLWGNHQETGLLVFLAILALDRPLALGLVAGLATWFCRTFLYAGIVLVPLGLWRADARGRARLVAGALVGLLPMLVPWSRGEKGRYHMDVASNLVPKGGGAILDRVGLLLDPFRLGVHTGTPWPLAAALLAAAVVAGVLAWRDRTRRWVVGLPLAYLAAFCASGFPIPPGGTLLHMRYHEPWVFALLVLIAVGATAPAPGPAPGPARWLLSVPLLCGLLALLTLPHRLDPAAFTLPATDPSVFAAVGVGRLDPERLAAATSADPRTDRVLRRMEGYQLALDVLGGRSRDDALAAAVRRGPLVVEGLGQGLASSDWTADDVAGAHRWLATLPADVAGPLAKGMTRNLVFAVDQDDLDRLGLTRSMTSRGTAGPEDVRRAVAFLTDGGDCAFCAAAGKVAVKACGRRSPADVARCLADVAPEDAVLFGAGQAIEGGMSRQRAEDVAAAMGERGQVLRDGMSDPFDSIEEPWLVKAAEGRPRPRR